MPFFGGRKGRTKTAKAAVVNSTVAVRSSASSAGFSQQEHAQKTPIHVAVADFLPAESGYGQLSLDAEARYFVVNAESAEWWLGCGRDVSVSVVIADHSDIPCCCCVIQLFLCIQGLRLTRSLVDMMQGSLGWFPASHTSKYDPTLPLLLPSRSRRKTAISSFMFAMPL